MSDELLKTLPEAEQKALSLCGITDARQLAKISPAALHQELEQARSFFQGDIPDSLLDEARLAEICAAAQTTSTFPDTAEQESEMLAADRIRPNVMVYGVQPQHRDEGFFVRHQPTESAFLKDIKQTKDPVTNLDPAKAERGKSMRFSTIRCGHPVVVYVGAFATIMLIPAALIVLTLLWQVITRGNTLPPERLGIGMVVVLAILAFYFLMNFHARCTVCHIHIFSLRKYPRNKYAFRIPLLGYSISTALRVFFTLKFSCPACGTKLKLGGHNKHRHHRSRENELYGIRRHRTH
ncbi:MAG: hypothetical protein Q3986_03980 [Akkermansia sp.]|nr:hypothetical protein [Akkermansia sp.]